MTTRLQTTRIIGRHFPAARWLTIVIGAWLVASAFALHDTGPARANSAIVGACLIGVALYAMFMPAMRRINTALAVWLVVSTLAVFAHSSRAALWNDVIAGVIVFLASLARDAQPATAQQSAMTQSARPSRTHRVH